MKFEVGMKVYDDLTGKQATIVYICIDRYKNWEIKSGLKLDNDYLDGYRFPWEVTELNKVKTRSKVKNGSKKRPKARSRSGLQS